MTRRGCCASWAATTRRRPLGRIEDLPELDPHEAFYLSRLESPSSLKEVLRQGDLERTEALERLCRLRAVELIVPEVPHLLWERRR